jgi:ribosomal protein S12 methylthiotransferase accessory factor
MIDNSAVKGYRQGTDRIVPPWQTLERVRPLMGVMGITRIANVTGLDSLGIPVTVVCRPNSRGLSVSQGKGLTLDAAKASGLMESVETWHAEHIRLPLLLGSQAELATSHKLIDVDRLPRPLASPFHPDLSLLWIHGRNLFTDEEMLLPFECVHADYTIAPRPGGGSFALSSNGLASGNHLAEATSHAICEVVERDALSRWYSRTAVATEPRVDLATVEDEGCQTVLGLCEKASLAVGAWDITSDIAIPTYVALIVDRHEDPLRIMFSTYGSGTHPDPGIALLRALTEAAQTRLTLIAGTREDLPRSEYERLLQPDAARNARGLLAASVALEPFRPDSGWTADGFDEDIREELSRLAAAGVSQVVRVDLTRPELGIPVVRVVIPGLEMVNVVPGIDAIGSRAALRTAAK